MPISSVTLVRSAAIAILVGLVALLSIVGMTLWLVAQTQSFSDRLFAARQQRAAIIDLKSLLQDAETGQRGYVLTGADSYLGPYVDARSKVATQVGKVRALVRHQLSELTLIDTLSRHVDGKLAELDKTVDLVKAGRRDAALDIVRTGRGRELMDSAREVLATLVADADHRVTTLVDEQRGSIAALRWVTILGAVVILAAAVALIWMVAVYARQIIRAQRDIQRLNAGLEERVRSARQTFRGPTRRSRGFAYIVTHDLRAPLVNIMGFTSELETSLAPIRGVRGTAPSRRASTFERRRRRPPSRICPRRSASSAPRPARWTA